MPIESQALIDTGKYDMTVFGVAAYGYNFERDFILKHSLADNVMFLRSLL